MGRIAGFLAVSTGDKFRLLLAAALLVTVRVGIVVVSFDRCRRSLLAPARLLSGIVPGSPSPSRVAWAVDAADRSIPGHRTCLMRSLSSETLHVLYGHDVIHRIGVDVNPPDDADRPYRSPGTAVTPPAGIDFEAHSWIEHDGTVIIGHLEDLSRFEPLPPLNDPGES